MLNDAASILWRRTLAGIVCGMVLAAGLPARGAEEPLTRIALGSCVRQNLPQPIWDAIVGFKPQLFLFIGDNIYGDSESMEVLRTKYKQLGDQPTFQRLKAACPILAIWDDHDYGVNDGGAEYPMKAESQQVFNEFFETPADSPRRQRPGLYDAQVFGPKGRRVQVILLDTRYFRSPLQRLQADQQRHGPFGPSDDPAATMLGEAQWKWLAEQLQQPAEVRIIASSIQVLPDQHGWEKWDNFPRERARLFRLVGEQQAAGVLFISGDRHRAELSQIDDTAAGYPLFDLTSSSLNAPSGPNSGEPNSHRLGEQYNGVNFGSITIDWETSSPTITLAVHNGDGETVLKHALKLSDLQPQKSP
ncbi:alkaline phosphatase D family protein [Lignipirellula cremea]|uniref:Phospholipase D n=1 Tax=Lignipirellula cremea TaxID=2528010 RepID=A0A518E0U1_9BACT|nr:alkaline phosphatase D family protein [Lignipirellula cremea]QDU97702.1 Phospholipase D precursor [Lignipirellula cremea]